MIGYEEFCEAKQVSERNWALFLESLTHSALYPLIILSVIVLGIASFRMKAIRNQVRGGDDIGSLATANRKLLVVRLAFAFSGLLFVFGTMDFGSAKMAALNSNCMSKAKQIAMAQIIYASDNDDKFVVAPNWVEPIIFYLGGSPAIVMHCRMAKGNQSYAVNSNLADRKVSTFEGPSSTVLVFESDTVSLGSQSDVAFDRHLDRANFGFADGHAHSASLKMSDGLMWTPKEGLGTGR
ncbi:MAG: hypothetical protein JSS65_03685 [Armatimonadetes bacterium]|nr:hypothetical protein [Armatimonadota bacterium]